mmetsp:Transcript_19619/g.41189  ORF Transcript_19619/g.41189 Transcript_19619/m.41189 type:complete len:190 (-) Transcript_19619:58-627(-)
MLEANFALKYKVRRGNRMLASALSMVITDANLGEDEAGEERAEGTTAAPTHSGPTPPVVAEGASTVENGGAEIREDAADGQNTEDESLVVESLEEQSNDQREQEAAQREQNVMREKLEAVGGKLDAVRGKLDAVHGELGGVHGNLNAAYGELGAVHGELGAVHEELGAEMDAVLAWIATENQARERGRR